MATSSQSSQQALAQPPAEYEERWMFLLWQKVTSTAGSAWESISKVGSNLTDLEVRNHSDLQELNSSLYSHLTADQLAALTKGNATNLHSHPIGSVDLDSANFSGTSWAALTGGQATALHNHYLSAGTYTLPTITNNGAGGLTVGSGDYCFFASAAGAYPINKYTIAGATYTLTDNSVNYLTANYSGGVPTISVLTSSSTFNYLTIFPIAVIYRTGLDLDLLNYDTDAVALSNKLLQRVSNVHKIQAEDGGFLLGETAGNRATITSGFLWSGAQRNTIPAFTSATDDFSFYYHVAGVWTKAAVTTYNNTQYDDGTALQTLASSKYTVNWVFKSASTLVPTEAYVVLGGGAYNLAQAQSSTIPANLPGEIVNTGLLVGRIIVQQGAATATQIDSVFTVALNFAPSTVASGLLSATTSVDVSASTAPTVGQVLTAVDATHATWQTPTAGAGGSRSYAARHG